VSQEKVLSGIFVPDWLRVPFPARAVNVSLHTVSRQAVGPTQSPIQGVTEAFSPGVKRPEREADNSLPSSVGFKNTWRYTSTHNMSS